MQETLVYESNNSAYSLLDFFTNMGQNEDASAIFLIPDLQREYVWNPSKIIDLVDSLFKGWPFGQVLLANTGKSTPIFSPRSFYQQVDNFTGEHKTFEVRECNKNTCLILDGQQRLQSLFLAFAPFSYGFVQDQRDWMFDPYRVKKGVKSSSAFLALNVENFCNAFELYKSIEKIDFSSSAKSKILQWVFKTPSADETRWWQRDNLPPVLSLDPSSDVRYILLKDIWKCETIESYISKIADGKSIDDEKAKALEVIFKSVKGLKHLQVPCTKILSQEDCGCSADYYNEMIVSIFTRLNAGGKPLTREDITFAWIKRYWGDSAKDAKETMNELLGKLSSFGIDINSDKLIKNLSTVWCIIENGGKALEPSDFLRGDLLKRIAGFLHQNWQLISSSMVTIAKQLDGYGVYYGRQYYSLESFLCLVTWQVIAKIWKAKHPGSVTDEINLDYLSANWGEQFAPRFVLGWQWADSHPNYRDGLSKLNKKISASTSHRDVFAMLTDWFDQILKSIAEEAKHSINALNRTSRAGVSAYTTQLWCWQRLESKRKRFAEILGQPRGGGISQGEPNVDHCVAHNFWSNFIAKTIEPGSNAYNETMSLINQLGNCSVLCKSTNCSKSDYTMKAFFAQCNWASDKAELLAIPQEMFSPDEGDLTVSIILDKIKARTQYIRNELCKFLDGELSLCK